MTELKTFLRQAIPNQIASVDLDRVINWCDGDFESFPAAESLYINFDAGYQRYPYLWGDTESDLLGKIKRHDLRPENIIDIGFCDSPSSFEESFVSEGRSYRLIGLIVEAWDGAKDLIPRCDESGVAYSIYCCTEEALHTITNGDESAYEIIETPIATAYYLDSQISATVANTASD